MKAGLEKIRLTTGHELNSDKIFLLASFSWVFVIPQEKTFKWAKDDRCSCTPWPDSSVPLWPLFSGSGHGRLGQERCRFITWLPVRLPLLCPALGWSSEGDGRSTSCHLRLNRAITVTLTQTSVLQLLQKQLSESLTSHSPGEKKRWLAFNFTASMLDFRSYFTCAFQIWVPQNVKLKRYLIYTIYFFSDHYARTMKSDYCWIDCCHKDDEGRAGQQRRHFRSVHQSQAPCDPHDSLGSGGVTASISQTSKRRLRVRDPAKGWDSRPAGCRDSALVLCATWLPGPLQIKFKTSSADWKNPLSCQEDSWESQWVPNQEATPYKRGKHGPFSVRDKCKASVSLEWKVSTWGSSPGTLGRLLLL